MLTGPTMDIDGRCIVFVLVLMTVSGTLAEFGEDISQDNEDNRFAVMGQVTKDTFDVEGGQVTLTLNVQTTVGTKEIWIMDFQEYRFNLDALPVDDLTGDLVMSRTSDCSSVYQDADWDTYFSNTYFDNKDATDLNNKNLFNSFTKGDMADDSIMRNDKITFTGSMATFFDCKDSNQENEIWDLSSVTTDEIEYRTKLYATNVRPKDVDDNTGGVSFVQSHIELIWRISRTALAKFLISSTALIQPILKFARVSTVYDEENNPVPEQAALHIKFRTVVDDANQMISYRPGNFTYIPENPNHSLEKIVYQPDGGIENAPACDLITDPGTLTQLQCHQTWEFKVILNVDTSEQVDNTIPIDASGTFEFLYNAFSCNISNDISTCELLDIDPSKISALITIQTTVFVQDEEEDRITVVLHTLTGASKEDLSYGTGSRGVAHKEYIDLRVTYTPAFLRPSYDLDLLLFMVCKGIQYSQDQFPQGCLQASLNERYVGHMESDFSYTPRISTVNGTVLLDPYNTSHLVDDIVQPLSTHYFMRADDDGSALDVPVHSSRFYNLALSAESETYTITAVYKLYEKTPTGKRRSAMPLMHDVVLARTMVGRPGRGKTSGVVITRHSRDVEESTRDAHTSTVPYTSLGCPKDAQHVPEELDCMCPAGTEYRVNSFSCEAPVIEEDKDQKDEKVNDLAQPASSAPHTLCSAWLVLMATSVILVLRNE